MDFKIVDGFVMGLETGFTLVLMKVNGLGGGEGGRGAERTYGFKQVLPGDVNTLRIVLAAFEILRHILDFRSRMSCLGLG